MKYRTHRRHHYFRIIYVRVYTLQRVHDDGGKGERKKGKNIYNNAR